jgi:4-hydroxy-tetrahydrodipicolinate synthase
VNGKVPIVAGGTFGGTIGEQAEFVKKMSATGVDAVVMITGILAAQQESDDVLNQRVLELIQRTDEIKLGLYECPVPYKRLLSPPQLKVFVSTGRFTYLKDTCLAIDQVKAKLKAANGCDSFGLYDAYMVHAVDSLRSGSAGLSCIQGNYFPELIVWLCENYDNENLSEEVIKVQQAFIDHMSVMHEVYPYIAKYFLQRRGLPISTYTRREAGEFNASVKEQIDKLYEFFGQLQKELNIPLAGYSIG